MIDLLEDRRKKWYVILLLDLMSSHLPSSHIIWDPNHSLLMILAFGCSAFCTLTIKKQLPYKLLLINVCLDLKYGKRTLDLLPSTQLKSRILTRVSFCLPCSITIASHSLIDTRSVFAWSLYGMYSYPLFVISFEPHSSCILNDDSGIWL